MSWLGRDYPSWYLAEFRQRAQPGPVGECWIWPEGHRSTAGYGMFSVDGVQSYSHRLSFALHHGDPGHFHVRHQCDTPPCWNPRCLLVGTAADNRQDSVDRDRTNFGVRAWNARLTDEIACEIFTAYHAGMSTSRLAHDYGLSVAHVHNIAHRRVWRRATAHLEVASLSRAERTLRGDSHPGAKLRQADIAEIRSLLDAGVARREVAARYGIGLTTIGRILQGVRT